MTERVTMRGEFGATSLANLLATVEQGGADAEVRLYTELGVGRVWFGAGALSDAEIGGISGEAALGRLMAAEEGRFEVVLGARARPRRIAGSVKQALQRQAARTAEWSRLLDLAPSLQARLVRTDALGAEDRLLPSRRAIIELCNGERSVTEVIDAAGRDAVEALREIVELIDAGYLRAAPPRTHASSVETRQAPGPIAEIPRAPALPRFEPELVTRLGNPMPEAEPEVEAKTTRYSSRPGTVEVIAVRPPSTPVPPDRRRDSSRRPRPATPVKSSMPPPRSADRMAMTRRDGTWSDPSPEVAAPPARPPAAAEPTPWFSPEAPASDAPFVGRYEVLCRLGRGGMGAVYLCRVTGEAGFRRLFALKVLRHRLRADPAAERAFLRESYVASRLHHPNAVAVVDAAVHARQPYLVLEYVEGCSLATLLNRNPEARPPELIVAIVIDALEGLAAAHALTDDDGRPLGLVHGDVSPENVLVGVDGSGRISDFGVSRLGRSGAIDDPWEPVLSRPGYVPPERALGRSLTPKADVFSMGVVLWNALTGHELFLGASAEETLHNVLSTRVPPPSTVGLHPPACFDSLCLAALERDPDRRLPSAQAMADELRQIAARHQLVAGRSDVSRWVREHFRRELEQRRLAILDAARDQAASAAAEGPALPRALSVAPPPVTGPMEGLTAEGPTLGDRVVAEAPPQEAEAPPDPAGPAGDPTLPSTERPPRAAEAEQAGSSRARNAVVIVSVLLALAAIGISILRPDMVASWFELDVSRRSFGPMPRQLGVRDATTEPTPALDPPLPEATPSVTPATPETPRDPSIEGDAGAKPRTAPGESTP